MKALLNGRPEINSILITLLQNSNSSVAVENHDGNIAHISRFIPETTIQQYQDKKALNSLIAKAQKFIENNQANVARDFDSGNFRIFDPSNGDNGCESRSSLLEIMQKQVTTKYAQLSPEEKLFLTLCHALRVYKLDQRDIFGLLVYEKYSEENREELELMGQAMSFISVKFMELADKVINDSKLSKELKPYQREVNGRLLPMQTQVFPSFMTMLNYIKAIGVPLIYRITRLETSLSSGTITFKCQGAGLIVKIPDGLLFRVASSAEENALQNKPVGIFEMFSVSTEKTRKSTIGSLQCLAKTTTFEEYMMALRKLDLEKLILDESRDLDSRHSGSKITNNSGLGGVYAFKPTATSLAVRNKGGSILTPCHFYISTYNTEKAEITHIPLDMVVGKKVQQNEYVGRT